MSTIGNELATRSLTLGDKEVTVTIFTPSSSEKYGGDCVCYYKIVGIAGMEESKRAIGIDGMQALFLALQRIGTDLYTSAEWRSGLLLWEGGRVIGDLGFPVPDSIKDIPPA